MHRTLRRAAPGLFAIVLTGAPAAAGAEPEAATAVGALKKLSLQELMDMEVSTASRRLEKLLETAAAVYVITQEDIRRSGVTSIPEALRLAPGVEVARTGAHEWSITIRGFNSNLANKLLVLIDGRSVYSPLYAGVFWDVQDLLLEDIDRIEVVAGPGGALWGANAVNGVINIITLPAAETQGGYVELGGGVEERGFAGARYGGRIGRRVAARGYVKAFERDASARPDGADGVDDWRMARGGFRLDWEPSATGSVTLQGDVYRGEEGTEFIGPFTIGTLPAGTFRGDVEVDGGNLLGLWSRELAGGSSLRLQGYYDRTHRDIPGQYAETRDTFDVDVQHHSRRGRRHDLLLGAGFRAARDRLDNTLFASFVPDTRTDSTFSAFAQDRIGLFARRVFLTLGSKFEHNDYSGFEIQPSLRLAWLLDERQTVWAAASRAVRIPSRLDSDLRLTAPVSVPTIPAPVYVLIDGSPSFGPEELLAYELGYRWQARDDVSFDVAGFYNDYDDLQSTEPLPPVIALQPPLPHVLIPNVLANGKKAESYGATVAADWRPIDSWRLRFGYTTFDLHMEAKPGSRGGTEATEGNSPANQVALHSFHDLPRGLTVYAGLRYVDRLPAQPIDAYTELDASLRWQARERVAVLLVGRNLLDDGHAEFGDGAANEIERSLHATVRCRY